MKRAIGYAVMFAIAAGFLAFIVGLVGDGYK